MPGTPAAQLFDVSGIYSSALALALLRPTLRSQRFVTMTREILPLLLGMRETDRNPWQSSERFVPVYLAFGGSTTCARLLRLVGRLLQPNPVSSCPANDATVPQSGSGTQEGSSSKKIKAVAAKRVSVSGSVLFAAERFRVVALPPSRMETKEENCGRIPPSR
jgi:hypothetical protein